MLLPLSFGVFVTIVVIGTLVSISLGVSIPTWIPLSLMIIAVVFIVLGATGLLRRRKL